MKKLHDKSLLILATTFPRWPDDSVPSFVQDFAITMTSVFRSVQVLVPHYRGAKRREQLTGGVNVRRFRYFFPYGLQDIVYEGHAAAKVKKSPAYVLKLLFFLLSQFWSTLWLSRQADIINAHWLIPQGFTAVLVGKILRKKVIVTIHGGDVFTLNSMLLRRIKRFTLRHADRVVVNSTATLEVCRSIFWREDYEIIPMGVDVKLFKPSGKIGRPSRPHRLLFVGRLSEEKGLRYLCGAMKKLYEKYGEDVHLDIVGGGPLQGWAQEYIVHNHLDSVVTLAGWVQREDLPQYYQQSDIFIGPSIKGLNGWREAYGLVYAEAMASGLVVVATDGGGSKDLVKHEETGYIIKQKSVAAIVDVVSKLIEDPVKTAKVKKSAMNEIKSKYSNEAMSSNYATVFSKLFSMK